MKRKQKMWAIMLDGDVVAGTISYSRKDAIDHLFGGGPADGEWKKSQESGYRVRRVTVKLEK